MPCWDHAKDSRLAVLFSLHPCLGRQVYLEYLCRIMKQMKIIYVCHGNICRSPMGEYILKKLVRDAGVEDRFEISSAAVSDEEWGNPIYPPAQATLRAHGIPFGKHSAHKISPAEFADADLVLIMDESNRRLLRYIVGDDRSGKVHMLMEYAGLSRSVADPWYTGDFETAFDDIYSASEALFSSFKL